MEELHAIISGRVQMVMYRDFTQRHARRLGIVGTVRNLEDGTVEVVAQGERASLEKLLLDLHKGPLLSKVAGVKASWRKPQQSHDSFEIATA